MPFICSRMQSRVALSNNMKWLVFGQSWMWVVGSPEGTKMTKMHPSLWDTCDSETDSQVKDFTRWGSVRPEGSQGALRAKGKLKPYCKPWVSAGKRPEADHGRWREGEPGAGMLETALDRHLMCLEIVSRKFILVTILGLLRGALEVFSKSLKYHWNLFWFLYFSVFWCHCTKDDV